MISKALHFLTHVLSLSVSPLLFLLPPPPLFPFPSEIPAGASKSACVCVCVYLHAHEWLLGQLPCDVQPAPPNIFSEYFFGLNGCGFEF